MINRDPTTPGPSDLTNIQVNTTYSISSADESGQCSVLVVGSYKDGPPIYGTQTITVKQTYFVDREGNYQLDKKAKEF